MNGRPLTILYSFPNPLGSPGIGTTALNQILGLRDLGHRCIVYCTSAVRPVPGVELHRTLELSGVRIRHRVVGSRRARAVHDQVVAHALRRLREEVDVVHVWPQGGLTTSRVATRLGIPSFREAPNTHTASAVATAAAVSSSLGMSLPKRHSHGADSRRLARELDEYGAASRVLAPSDHVAETFRDHGFPDSRLARHRYGCDLDRFAPSADALAMPSAPGPVFAFVGSVEPRKGLHLLASTWAEAIEGTSARLLVVGRLMPSYRPHVARLLDDSSTRWVDFTDDVPNLLRSADVLVLPSLEEGSALVSYEAQASGCALLVSDAAGALAEHGAHGLIHRAGDVDALRRDVRRLAGDRDLLAQLRSRVLADRDRLSWLEAARALEYCYLEALPMRRR